MPFTHFLYTEPRDNCVQAVRKRERRIYLHGRPHGKFTLHDTVRHNTLMQKMVKFPLPDHAYNWVADFLLNRKHMTRFEQTLSTVLAINASIIQGSVTGPTIYVLNASDLKTIEPSNSLNKYADDTYLIVPATSLKPSRLNWATCRRGRRLTIFHST